MLEVKAFSFCLLFSCNEIVSPLNCPVYTFPFASSCTRERILYHFATFVFIRVVFHFVRSKTPQRKRERGRKEKKSFSNPLLFFFSISLPRWEAKKGLWINYLLLALHGFFSAASLINCRFESDAQEICDDMKLMFHFHHKCSRGLLMIIICSLKCFFCSFVIPRFLRV